MARTDSLRHYLSDVADAIRTAGGTAEKIKVSEFDNAILNISGGGNGGNEPIINIQTVHTPEQIRFSKYPVATFNPIGLNTSKVTDMTNMFSNSINLVKANLVNFNTEKVTNMAYMFSNCSNLQSIDLSNFNTSKVIDMVYMFSNCSNLQSIDLSNFNTEKIINFTGMFSNCGIVGNNNKLNLTNIIKGNSATNVGYMFYNCPNLTELELVNFNAGKLQNGFNSMFMHCNNLTTLNLANFNGININTISNRYDAFEECPNLKYINLSNFNSTCLDLWPGRHFEKLHMLESIDVSGLCRNGIDGKIDISGLFEGCSNLKTVNISNLLINCPPTSLSCIFSGCTNLNVDNIVFDFDGITSLGGAFNGCHQLTSFDFETQVLNMQSLVSISSMFSNCINLKTINLSNLSTGNISSMSELINGCYNLTSVDMSYFNGSNINISDSDSYPKHLLNTIGSNYFVQNLNLSYWYSPVSNNLAFGGELLAEHINLSNALIAPGAISSINFYGGSNSKTKTIDLSNTDLSGVKLWSTQYMGADFEQINFTNSNFKPTNLGWIFKDAYFNTFNINKILGLNFEDVEVFHYAFKDSRNLVSVDLNGIYLNKPCSIQSLFFNCQNLASVNFNNFIVNETNGLSFSYMFYNCRSLTTLNLGDFSNRNAIYNLSNTFNSCSNLTAINFGNFDAGNINNLNKAFYGCSNLTTLQGQINNLGKAYAPLNSWWQGNEADINFTSSPLTRESALIILNGLYNLAEANITSRNIYFSTNTKALLTDTDIEPAKNKGWQISL